MPIYCVTYSLGSRKQFGTKLMITSFLGVAILGYVFGSLPIHRFLGLPDFDAPGTHASFLRNTSRFLVNISKGLLVVHIAEQFGPPEAMIAAFAVAFGHNYPLWPNFRGGIGPVAGPMRTLLLATGVLCLSKDNHCRPECRSRDTTGRVNAVASLQRARPFTDDSSRSLAPSQDLGTALRFWAKTDGRRLPRPLMPDFSVFSSRSS